MATYTFNLKITGTVTSDGAVVEPPIDPPVDPPIDPPVDPPVDPITPPPDYSKPADISVGPTHDIKEPADAMATLPLGGIIEVDDGVYKKAFHVENHGMTIRSKSGNPYKCYFDGQGGYGGGHRLAWGKGMLHSSKAINVIGMGFRNCGSPQSGTIYSNEGGIWIGDSDGTTPIEIVIQRCAFDNNANGVFAAYDKNIKIKEVECLFGYIASNGHNAASVGSGGGPAHDNYLGVGEIEVTQSMFWGCCGGHNVKSRSQKSNVHDNPCMTQDGGRVFEVPDGGEATFKNNVIHTRTNRTSQPPVGTYGNSNMIAYCDESSNNGTHGMALIGNTYHISRINSTIWAAAGAIVSSGDTVHYYSPDGSLQLQGNVQGLSQGSAPPGSPSAPPLPSPPSWAVVGTTVTASPSAWSGKPKKADQGPEGWNELPTQDMSYIDQE